MQDSITALTKQLAIVVLNNTATQVADNVEKARAQIDKEKTTAALEQIINELVRDKAELTRIAQAYEQELASQKITKKRTRVYNRKYFAVARQVHPRRSKGDSRTTQFPFISRDTRSDAAPRFQL